MTQVSRSSMLLSLIFNLITAISGISSIVWLRLIGGFRSKSVYYYTIWTVFAQIITSCIFFVSDLRSLLTTNQDTEVKNGPKLKNKKEPNLSISAVYKFLLFHGSFMMTISTFLMFWIIYAIDPTALIPKEMYYPTLMNHMHHTFPFIFSVIHMFIFANNEINSFKLNIGVMHANELGMPFVFLINSAYSCLIIVSSLIRKIWPYPFLNLLTTFQLAVLFIVGNVLGLMISNISNQILFKIAKSMKVKSLAKKIK